jgi:hypothetical protein
MTNNYPLCKNIFKLLEYVKEEYDDEMTTGEPPDRNGLGCEVEDTENTSPSEEFSKLIQVFFGQ